jgi:hypothetical protein
MSREVSPSTSRRHGVLRVTRVWGTSRATVDGEGRADDEPANSSTKKATASATSLVVPSLPTGMRGGARPWDRAHRDTVTGAWNPSLPISPSNSNN